MTLITSGNGYGYYYYYYYYSRRQHITLGFVELCAKILQIMRNDFNDYTPPAMFVVKMQVVK